MVRGLDLFREHFRDQTDSYLLIGGTACDLLFGEAGLAFRATKDLDIVLCIEALDTHFAQVLWDFIKAGQYGRREEDGAKRQYYRFKEPASEGFPYMLELFSRKPDALTLAEGSHLSPILLGDDVSSLSAILLDDDYYRFLMDGRTIVEGLAVVGPERLIPLKARAWLDLTDRKSRGESVDSKAIRKHRNDVFRLYRILDPTSLSIVPPRILDDLERFLAKQAGERTNLKALGLAGRTVPEVVADLCQVFGL